MTSHVMTVKEFIVIIGCLIVIFGFLWFWVPSITRPVKKKAIKQYPSPSPFYDEWNQKKEEPEIFHTTIADEQHRQYLKDYPNQKNDPRD